MDAELMLYELESNYLEVVLIPAAEKRHSEHCVRAVQYQNADWYRRFCAEYLSGRRYQNSKGRTLIKRRETIRALQKISQGEIDDSPYVTRLLDFMEREAKNQMPDVRFNWLKMNRFKNILSVLERADDIDIDEGRLAYWRYHEVCRNIASRFDVSLPVVVAVVAATSPNCDYKGNLRSALTVLDAFKTGTPFDQIKVSCYRKCAERALSYCRGVDFWETVKGEKIRSFYQNILHPQSAEFVTIDGHAVNIWRGERVGLKELKPFKYKEVAEDYRRAARRVSLLPNQVQAITWFAWKRINNIIYKPPQNHLFVDKSGDYWGTLGTLDGLEPYRSKAYQSAVPF